MLFLGPAMKQAMMIALVALPILIWLFHCSRVGTVQGIGSMIGRLIAGITLFDAFFILVFAGPVSALDLRSAWLQAALVCAAFLPATLFLQRRIPAT